MDMLCCETVVKMAKKKETEFKQDWNSISGNMRIFGNEIEYSKKGKKSSFVKYSTSVGTKDEDGDYVNAYLDVQFTKDCGYDPDGATGELHVQVNKAFLGVDYWDDGDKRRTKLKLIVQDADAID